MSTWIKLYTEILADPKMGRLTDSEHRTCITCFLMAGQNEEEGLVGSEQDIEWQLRRSVASDLRKLAELDIMETIDGQWYVVHFSKRQARKPSDEPAAVRTRVQAHRNRIGNADVTPDVTPDVTQGGNAIEEKRGEEKRGEEKRKSVTSAAAADPAFAELWQLLTSEHIVMAYSDVIRDDVSDMFAQCQDGRAWREAVKRAKSRDPSGANWAFVKRIMADYIKSGSFDKPKNSAGPPGIAPPRVTGLSEADLEWQREHRRAETAKTVAAVGAIPAAPT